MCCGNGWDGSVMVHPEMSGDGVDSLPDYFPLRKDLKIWPRDDGTGRVNLENPTNGRFYRFGKLEHQFLLALQETESAWKSFEHCQRLKDGSSFSPQACLRLCQWLAHHELTELESQAKTPDLFPKHAFLPKTISSAFFFKLPLCNPNRLLKHLAEKLSWMLSNTALLVAFAVLIGTLISTLGKWEEFIAGYDRLISPWRFSVLAVAWVVLKFAHELGHGLMCRKNGGEVEEAGLAFVLFMPLAYVDVTSSWRFASRWQRLQVTLAGVVAEILIAVLALIVWNCSSSIVIRQAAADVVILASISSLVFNLNPLLKFDGYFALADLSGVDNLYVHGRTYAHSLGRRIFLGIRNHSRALPADVPGWVKTYGCAAALYRTLTVGGLLIAASTLFHGAGILLAVAGFFLFVIAPLRSLGASLAGLYREGSLRPFRLFLRLGALTAVVLGLLFIAPVGWNVTAPAIVQYSPPAIVRNQMAGFVETVHVSDGDTVLSQQPLVTLRDDDLQLKLRRQKKQLAQVQQEIRSAQWRGQSSELKDAMSRHEGLLAQVDETQKQVDQLVIRAPREGKVVSRRIELIMGTYLKPGEELAVIGNERSKRLKVSIGQREARQAANWRFNSLRILVEGHPSWDAKLIRLETRAGTSPPDDSMLVVNGGPLAVVHQASDEFELCHPRVNAYIQLDELHSEMLRAGQRVVVALPCKRPSLGRSLLSFIDER